MPRPGRTARVVEVGLGSANATADRAIDILLLFSTEHPSWTASEIADHFDMPRSTTYRYLTTLRSYALLVEDARGGYGLGPRILPLARVARANLSVIKLSAPEMARLNEEFGELVVLHERIGAEVVPLERLECRHPVSIASTRSHILPWPATSSAKVFLAFAPDAERDEILRLLKPVAYTKRTLRDKNALLQALVEVRRNGYAITDEERDNGVWGIAAPIASRAGVRYCIGLVIPRFRVDDKRKLITAVIQAANRIAEAIAETEI